MMRGWLLASAVIIRGMVPFALGCPDSLAPARELQTWTARSVRGPVALGALYNLAPGQPWGMVIIVSAPIGDTLSFRIWGRNSAGDGCQVVEVETVVDP
jgi:hypothetical protein